MHANVGSEKIIERTGNFYQSQSSIESTINIEITSLSFFNFFLVGNAYIEVHLRPYNRWF